MSEIHPAFLTTSHDVCMLKLCHVRLQADARFPWLVLIPQGGDFIEIEDLSAPDRARLIEEAVLAGQAVRAIGAAMGLTVEKLNLGALGNITPQLHLHVVGRRAGDPAWPGPVWGVSGAQDYQPEALGAAIAAAKGVLERGG